MISMLIAFFKGVATVELVWLWTNEGKNPNPLTALVFRWGAFVMVGGPVIIARYFPSFFPDPDVMTSIAVIVGIVAVLIYFIGLRASDVRFLWNCRALNRLLKYADADTFRCWKAFEKSFYTQATAMIRALASDVVKAELDPNLKDDLGLNVQLFKRAYRVFRKFGLMEEEPESYLKFAEAVENISRWAKSSTYQSGAVETG